MAILPLQLARVSNLLRTSVATSAIPRTQQQLLEVQNQLATGKRLNAPSDDPGDSAIVMQLQKTLEQRNTYSDNLKQANSLLSESDSTLGDITDLMQQAQTLASANVGSDVTPAARAGAAEVVKSLYSQMLSLANKSYGGVYIFGGDRSTTAPFVESNGGIQFVGSTTALANTVDENSTINFMVDGDAVFGALSTRIQGTTDLTPSLAASTRLADLKGAGGSGIHPGLISLSNGVASPITLDLSTADTVGDVINAVNAAGLGITASIAPGAQNLTLSGAPGDNLTITDIGGGSMASDLGIRQSAAGPTLTGTGAQPAVTLLTPLSNLRAGAPIDQTSGITITNGQTTRTLTFGSCNTVQDLLNTINGSGTGVRAEINAAGTGINLLNPTQGTQLTVAENGGTTAADLGIRSFSPASPLAELNGGKGVSTAAGADFQINKRDGTSVSVDIDGLSTTQDVIDAINTAAGYAMAGFATTGNGIQLTDNSATGSAPFAVVAQNFSRAAEDLGLLAPASGATITGTDVNPVAASGVFANLGQLRDALQSNDQAAITAAAAGLKDDFDRITRVRGQTGARVQELESRQNRLDDENVATQSLLSNLSDTDFTEAITRFQTLQTALQATLQSASQIMNQSLLDFLK
jgi:flagellin-like hook-associated protein FlgL